MSPIESMGQYDWAHLDLFLKSQLGYDQHKSNHACYACLFNCFVMLVCYNLDNVSYVYGCHGLSLIKIV